jgi:hypothetical protein
VPLAPLNGWGPRRRQRGSTPRAWHARRRGGGSSASSPAGDVFGGSGPETSDAVAVPLGGLDLQIESVPCARDNPLRRRGCEGRHYKGSGSRMGDAHATPFPRGQRPRPQRSRPCWGLAPADVSGGRLALYAWTPSLVAEMPSRAFSVPDPVDPALPPPCRWLRPWRGTRGVPAPMAIPPRGLHFAAQVPPRGRLHTRAKPPLRARSLCSLPAARRGFDSSRCIALSPQRLCLDVEIGVLAWSDSEKFPGWGVASKPARHAST